jgi:hypothetical protein
MLFMVIEHFKDGRTKGIGARFAEHGRMLPDGVTYHASWVEPTGRRCFQVMEAPRRELLDVWTSRWNDLVDFEIVPVLTSAEFWKEAERGTLQRQTSIEKVMS